MPRRTRPIVVATAALVLVLALAGPAGACGGLIGRKGAVNLARTTTLAAYHEGIEHYVTAFDFQGGGGEFGSIVPLPGIPTNVERGGDWTLQRLVRETQPVFDAVALSAAAPVRAAKAEVLLETRVDALDITVLRGGGNSVGEWAKEHGFLLPPDAPEVFDFYARRSPIFMAARFDAEAARARGQGLGDGTPIHLTIPTDNPWVPLRILGLGKGSGETVGADVYLLTDGQPALLAGDDDGLRRERSEAASSSLLADLRSDKGMEWVPDAMWLSYLRLDTTAGALTYDLAVDTSGANRPSPVAAGLRLPGALEFLPGHLAGGANDGENWGLLLLAASLGAVLLAGAAGAWVGARRPALR
jgi:hypothetical protein